MMRTMMLVLALVMFAGCGANKSKEAYIEAIDGVDGNDGADGKDGTDGADGKDGADGADATSPGLLCNVHDLSDWNRGNSLPEALTQSSPVGSFILPNLSVGDSPSKLGFPGMPLDLQAKVGLEGYALDCFGYLWIETSGVYTLSLLSDDGVFMAIEDNFVTLEDQGLHAPRTVSTKASLRRGQNKFNIMYFQGPHTQIALELRMSGPHFPSQVVPAANFSH